MSENFLQKLEDRVMTLLTELEETREQIKLLRQENKWLKTNKENYVQKVQNLIGLLEKIDHQESANPIYIHNNMEEITA